MSSTFSALGHRTDEARFLAALEAAQAITRPAPDDTEPERSARDEAYSGLVTAEKIIAQVGDLQDRIDAAFERELANLKRKRITCISVNRDMRTLRHVGFIKQTTVSFHRQPTVGEISIAIYKDPSAASVLRAKRAMLALAARQQSGRQLVGD